MNVLIITILVIKSWLWLLCWLYFKHYNAPYLKIVLPLSVGRSVYEWVEIIILKTIYHRAFVVHMLIGLGEDKNPILGSLGQRSRLQSVFRSLSYELFITLLLYLTYWLVLARTWPVLSLLGQRSRAQGELLWPAFARRVSCLNFFI